MKMDKLGEEVSEKIKCAITAKLAELGVHIDNELPDYVMVLVANKKSQKQMDEDLTLFLGDSTTVFTTWLYDVLKKLEQFTITSKGMKRKRHKKCSVESEDTLFNKKGKFGNENNTSPESSIENNNLSPQDVNNTNEQDHYVKDRMNEEDTDGDRIQHKLIDYSEEDEQVIGEEEDLINLHDNNEVIVAIAGSSIIDKNTSTNITTSNVHTKQQQQIDKLNGNKDEVLKSKEKIKIVWDNESKQLSDSVGGGSYENLGLDKTGRSDIKETANSSSNRKEVYGYYDSNNIDKPSDFGATSDLNRNSELKSSNNNIRENLKLKDARDIIKKRSNLVSKSVSYKRQNKLHSRKSRDKSSKEDNQPQRCLSSVTKPVIKEPEKPSVPSLVKVTPRPVRSPGMQATCNLILKAVADAEKSIAATQLTQKKTQKKKEIPEVKNFGDFKNYQLENISVTLLNDRIISNDTGTAVTENVSSGQQKDLNEAFEAAVGNEVPVPASPVPESEKTHFPPSEECTTLFTTEESPLVINAPRFIITLDSTASDTELESELDSSKLVAKVEDKEEVYSPEETLTVVRQAFDKRRLGPRPTIIHDENSDCRLFTIDETTESSQEIEMESSEIVSESAKSQTRCKYWPCCDAGSTCSYYHPTTLCRLFPSCPYGEKCLYIHPACKFADKCLKVDCPFAHTSATPLNTKSTSFKIATPSSTVFSQVCKFYPRCTKPYCLYIHVKKQCKFGSSCNKIGCEFEHPNRISKNPYKWLAENQ